ncbi:MAG: hypothetical protein AB7Q37_06630 [Pyrinomonadaceae bacterium]
MGILKNMVATGMMVAVLGVGTFSHAGIIIGSKAENTPKTGNNPCSVKNTKVNSGIIIGSLLGIIIGSKAGIIIGSAIDNGGNTNCGIIIGS